MEPLLWGFIGTITGAIVGSSTSIATTLITTRNSSRIQHNLKEYERSERARDFQRITLLAIQEVFTSGIRLITRAHMEDLKSFRKRVDVNSGHLLSEDLNNELMMSNKDITVLKERISDTNLRESIKILQNEMNNVLTARDEDESIYLLDRAILEFQNTMEKLGVVLRKNF